MPRPVGGHRVLRGDRAQHDRVGVRPLVTLHADRADRRQHGEALPQLAIEARATHLLEQHGVGHAEDLQPLLRDVSDDADRKTGARERMAPHHPLRQAELLTHAPHLVLEQEPQRLDELHAHVGREPADVVVGLDGRGHADLPARLDHVRVERSLHEEANVAELPRLLLEDADELLADDLPLLLRVGHAREPCEEALTRVHVHERDVEVPAERLHDLFGLVCTQQAMIDEDARELVTDRLVHEQRGDGRVDTARQTADHLLGADLGPDPVDLLLDHGCRRPRGRDAHDLVEEVLQHLLPVRRVHDLRVELHAVPAAALVLESGDRRRRRRGRHPRAGGRRGHGVAVAHPDGLLGRQVVEEKRLLRLQFRLPVLRGTGRSDGTTEVASHQLHPVADAERRDTQLEDVRVDGRRAVRVDRRGPTREDQAHRVPLADLGG